MTDIAIQVAHRSDTDEIRGLALDNHMFAADEMGGFDEILGAFFDGELDGHQWLVATKDGESSPVAGAAYYAPEPFSDRMWNLYFIATDPDQHGAGAGTALIEHVETALRRLGEAHARTLIVDTSSLDDYDQARAFYERRGFVEEARVRDFYGPGDHKVTFWKSLCDELP